MKKMQCKAKKMKCKVLIGGITLLDFKGPLPSWIIYYTRNRDSTLGSLESSVILP